jgi:hypothetical protein
VNKRPPKQWFETIRWTDALNAQANAQTDTIRRCDNIILTDYKRPGYLYLWSIQEWKWSESAAACMHD